MLSILQIDRFKNCRCSKRHGESFLLAPSTLSVLSLWPPFFPVPMANSHRRNTIKELSRLRRRAFAVRQERPVIAQRIDAYRRQHKKQAGPEPPRTMLALPVKEDRYAEDVRAPALRSRDCRGCSHPAPNGQHSFGRQPVHLVRSEGGRAFSPAHLAGREARFDPSTSPGSSTDKAAIAESGAPPRLSR